MRKDLILCFCDLVYDLFLHMILSSAVYFWISQNGRRPLLQLLHPNCSRYFSPDDLASMNSSIPSLSLKVSFVLIFSVFLYVSNSLITSFKLIAVRTSQKQAPQQKLPRFQLVTMIPRKTWMWQSLKLTKTKLLWMILN